MEWHVRGLAYEADDHFHAFRILVGCLANDDLRLNERTR
jgi:hypothetical protein